jgi:hypothetical protein
MPLNQGGRKFHLMAKSKLKKLTILPFFHRNFLIKAGTAALVFVIAATALFYSFIPRRVFGQTYLLVQNDWSGGTSGSTVFAPDNLTGYDRYVSASNAVTGATSVTIDTPQSSFSETFTSTTYRDAANTTATWNTSGQISGASPNAITNLTSVLTGEGLAGNWGCAAMDQTNRAIYMMNSAGHLAKYDILAGTADDITDFSNIDSFWGANGCDNMAMLDGKIYVQFGYPSRFASVDPDVANSAVDLKPYVGAWAEAVSMAADTTDSTIYLAGYNFVKFDPADNSVDIITSPPTLPHDLSPIIFNPDDGNIYLTGGAAFYSYNPTLDQVTNLTSSSGYSGVFGSRIIRRVGYSSGDDTMYLVSNADGPSVLATYVSGGSVTNVGSGVSWGSGYSAGAITPNTDGSTVLIPISYESNWPAFHPGTPNTLGTIAMGSSINDMNTGILLFDNTASAWYTITIGGTNDFRFVRIDENKPPLRATSLTIDSTSQNIISATLTKNDTPGTGTVSYQLSNDGGSHWENVTAGILHTFSTTGSDLRFKILLTGNATVQDVAIDIDLDPSVVTSSKFDSGDATNVLNQLVWHEDTSLPAGTSVMVSLRSAADSTSLDAASWTDFTNASSNCSKVTGTVTCGASALPEAMQDGSGDRWFQYKLTLISENANTPTFSSISIQFVVNAPPEVRNVAAVQNANGTVTISYEVRDLDTAGGSPANRDHVTPMFEYWNGSSYQTITTLAAGDTDVKAVAHDGSWNEVTYTATWTPSTDFNGHYQNNTAQVRVTANDGEGANPTGSAESATYSLDTQIPTGVSLTVDASAATPTAHLAETEDNPGTMRVSATDPTLNSTDPETFSTTKSLPSLTEGATVYARVTDAYNNSANIVSATLPATPTSVIIQDISNLVAEPHAFRLFLAWKAVSGSFASYRIHRSETAANPEDWSEVDSIAVQATNYYVDNNVVEDGGYYYYIETVDSSGNVSFRSSVVHATANGTQDGGEGGGGTAAPPVISLVSSGTPHSTEATITWDTDALSNSVVQYSTSPSTFTTTVTVGSLVDNASGVGAHSVILSGLIPERTYYFRVRSTDISEQMTTADNGGVGYTFTTAAGPVITNASVEQTTNTTARMSWTTNILSTTQLVHSIHADMSEPTVTTGTSDPTVTHIVNLTNLTAGTIYYFYVRSVDASLNETVDKHIVDGIPHYYTFTTTNDTTAPVISEVSVRTQSTAVDIIWTTNESADSQIEYGTTTAYGTTTTLDSTATLRHVVTITGLSPQTAYDYRIRTRDVNAVLAIGDNQTFTTLEAGDATAPGISGVRVASLSLNAASIHWTTDESATSYVDYGTTTGLGTSAGSETLATSHTVSLTSLTTGTPYYYRVRSTDAAGNEATDNNDGDFYVFTPIADAIGPEVSALDDIISMNSFRVVWTTNELADSQVEYGASDSYGSSTTLAATLVLDHSVTVSSLTAATTYHYRIRTRDVTGNITIGSDRVVTTAAQADNTPPVITSPAASSITRTTAVISWTTDEESDSEVQYGPNLTYGYSAENANDNTTDHAVTISGLTPGTIYYFKVISTDGSGNIASDDNDSAGFTFTTIIDNTPPVITLVSTQLAAENSAVIIWTTDEPATSQVAYGISTSYGSQTLVNPALSTFHSVAISSLTASTQYFYEVISVDAYANSATDDNDDAGYTFTTATGAGTPPSSHRPEVDITPPVIMNLKVGSIGKRSAEIEWTTDEPADTIVKYGSTIAYGTLAGSIDEKISSHKVSLTDLASGTIYHFIAVSTDASGNQGTTTDRMFATLNEDGTVIPLPEQPETPAEPAVNTPVNANTPAETPSETERKTKIMTALSGLAKDPDLTLIAEDVLTSAINEIIDRVVRAPSIVGPVPKVEVTGTTAKVSWVTDKKTNGIVALSEDGSYNPSAADPYPFFATDSNTSTTIHEVEIDNLSSATKYHFQVRSKGLIGGEARSDDAVFTTASELPQINDLTISRVSDFSATLSWRTNVPTQTNIEYRNLATETTLTQGDIALLKEHTLILDKLTAGAAYSVVVVATDELGNKTSSKTFSIATSKDTSAPVISKVSSSSTLYPGKESRIQTIITWSTDEPSTSHVFYQEGLAKDATQIEVPFDPALVTSHTVVITKFRPMTVYKFHVESADLAANTTKSNDFLVLTPQQKASVLDIIIGNFEQVFGWTKKLQ